MVRLARHSGSYSRSVTWNFRWPGHGRCVPYHRHSRDDGLSEERTMNALRWKVILSAALLATAAGVLGGCGTSPLGPVQAPPMSTSTAGISGSPPIVSVSSSGGVAYTLVSPERDANLAGST